MSAKLRRPGLTDRRYWPVLQTRGAPVAAEPPPVAGPTPADEGQTIIARVVDHPKPAEPRSPFGELIAYPFLIQASQP
jgi:hypothetical protein